MERYGLKTGIAEQHFQPVAGCRVPLEDNLEVSFKGLKHENLFITI
jgi:hypothetical protein